jgi:4-hydroxybenzoate polyprenyltransferase
VMFWACAGYLAGAGLIAAAALVSVIAHFVWQVRTLDMSDPQNCLVRFRSNCTVGWLLVAGLVAQMAWGALMGG